ncbi:uncharacterized protein [Ptychodera flava]|uniref:uncharacterized protein n=1 Tax=Ptychodera flava TaxID=63121 RepID=UPI00396A9457
MCRIAAKHIISVSASLTIAIPVIISLWLVKAPLFYQSEGNTHLYGSTLKNREHRPDIVSAMSGLSKAKEGALLGMLVADSIAMPVHWYYNVRDIKKDFGGWLTGYQAPKYHHPSSILTISAVGGAGRSTSKTSGTTPVIGRVILHDKLKYWTSPSDSIHYHQGMSSGDNTLNSVLAIQVANSIREAKTADPGVSRSDLYAKILTDYVKFMTTPGSHNDTYAESFHREFFSDWEQDGSPVEKDRVMEFAEKRSKRLRSGHVDHNIDSIGALVLPIPLILHYADQSEDQAAQAAVDFVKLTHCSKGLDPYVDLYARTLHSVVNGASLMEKASEALQSPLLGGDGTLKVASMFSDHAKRQANSESALEVYQRSVSQLGLACYIDGAITSMFFLARNFHEDFESGVLTNANCGGENCHRGAALGALLGAAAANQGKGVPPRFAEGLQMVKKGLLSVL